MFDVSDSSLMATATEKTDQSCIVKFGKSPVSVVKEFDKLCNKFDGLTAGLKHLLSRKRLRSVKYEFLPLLDSAVVWEITVPSFCSEELDQVLEELDEYVQKNRLRDRASGIEELLYGDNLTMPTEEISTSIACSSSSDQANYETSQSSTSDDSEIISSSQTGFCIPENCTIEYLRKINVDPINSFPDSNLIRSEMEVVVHEDLQEYLGAILNPTDESPCKERNDVKLLQSITLECPLCKEVFNSKFNLQTHCRQAHQQHLSMDKTGKLKLLNRKLLQCDQCDYRALRGGRMLTHRKEVHGIVDEVVCGDCGKVFDSYRNHHHHVQQFHTLLNVACDICGKICRNRSAFMRHHLSHRRSFQCRYCGKVFHDRRCILQHEKSHSDSHANSCQQCDKTFNSKSNLERHVKVMHLKEGKLMCKLCPFSSYYSNTLKDHIERVHKGKKKTNFTCQHCNKTFGRKMTYQEHMDRHDGRYRYSCEKCGKKFRNKARCKKHSEQLCTKQVQNDFCSEIADEENEVSEKGISLDSVTDDGSEQIELVYSLSEALVEES